MKNVEREVKSLLKRVIIGYSEFKSENKVMLERGYPLGWGLTMMRV